MSRENFEAWFYAPEQKELRESCAPGWAYRTWQAATASMQSERNHLAAQLADVVAENAELKGDVPLGAIENGRAFADRLEAYPFWCEGGNLNMCSDWQELRRCFEHLSEWAMHHQSESPATDRFLAEQRAVGVDMAIKTAKSVVAQEFQYKDFDTAQRVCSRFPESDLVGKVEMVEWLSDYAAQLRNEVKV
ncbi:hypothetical protein [Enterobacter kobei]|uniref:Uncharacterized protein n=2 Tax=Enterobacter kobei TaxID=208224 RepID=A0ACC8SD82_9ENTR|nr:hypothetical protein [Enterobacter kobei]OLR21479.1 hypothetical protein BH713_12900 [Enterobacter kobei]BCU55133.1 hypothetical protein ENKO_17270 [Enterobacter kobei]SIQ95732.1 hypothetical protein SAMN05444841_102588 [Enterobacter kobei]